MSTQDPRTYLSTADRQTWSVIHQGMPVCAPTTLESARKAASAMRLTLPPVIWNGTAGRFEPLD